MTNDQLINIGIAAVNGDTEEWEELTDAERAHAHELLDSYEMPD